MKLLKQLTAIQGASSDERKIAKFILTYIDKNKADSCDIATGLCSQKGGGLLCTTEIFTGN